MAQNCNGALAGRVPARGKGHLWLLFRTRLVRDNTAAFGHTGQQTTSRLISCDDSLQSGPRCRTLKSKCQRPAALEGDGMNIRLGESKSSRLELLHFRMAIRALVDHT